MKMKLNNRSVTALTSIAVQRQRIDVQHYADGLFAFDPFVLGPLWHRRVRYRIVVVHRLRMEHHIRVRLDAGRQLSIMSESDFRWSGTLKVRGIAGTRARRLHEVIRVRLYGRRQEHGRSELVAEPRGTAVRRTARVRQEPVDVVRRPDGNVPRRRRQLGLLGQHTVGRGRAQTERRCPGNVLHHVQHALGRERRPVSGRELREVGPASEPVHTVRIVLDPRAAVVPARFVGRLDRRWRWRRRPSSRYREQPHGSQVVLMLVSVARGRFRVVDPLRYGCRFVCDHRVVFRMFHAQHCGQEPVVRGRRTVAQRRLLVLDVLGVTSGRAGANGRGDGLCGRNGVIEKRKVQLYRKRKKRNVKRRSQLVKSISEIERPFMICAVLVDFKNAIIVYIC